MSVGPYRKVVWVFDREHTKHPFILLSLETLARAGCDVTIIDGSGAPEGASYRGFADIDLYARGARWKARIEAKSRLLLLDRAASETRRDRIREKYVNSPEMIGLLRLIGSNAYSIGSRFVNSIYFRMWRRVGFAHHKTVGLWGVYARAFRRLWSLDVEVIVATRPPAALVAFPVAFLRSKRFVYYPFELYGCQKASYSTFVAWWERLVLRWGVDELITQNEARAEVYRQRGFRSFPAIVHNYKKGRKVQGSGFLREKLNLRPQQRIVLYEGLLIEGRWLDRLVQSSLLLPPDVVLVMMGRKSPWWEQNFDVFAVDAARAGRLMVVDEVPHEQVLEHVADADVGVIIYDDTVLNNYLCEPGKLSDYVVAGVPVVAPAFPTIAPVIQRLHIGACFERTTPEAISAAIGQVLSAGRDTWAPALEIAAQELEWSTQEPNLIAAITSAQSAKQSIVRK